jgi:ATP-dependent RNA helicase DeaD
VVALVTPRQISTLRRMAGGAVAPLALPESGARARSREESLRDELRAVLQTEQYARELVMLEPLLTDHDGAEIAAAALRLLERQRATPVTLGAALAQGAVTRLYINVGAMDDIRPGDLVGAITNEAGISRAELGRVDVRDKHSTVEVATPVANAVVSKLTGVQMKGRRIIARVDEDRPRERRDGQRSSRPGRPERGGRGDRGDRGGDRGDRRGPPRDRRPSRERPGRDR